MSSNDPYTACQCLIAAFAHYVDSRQPERAAQLFTEDATFERKGEVLRGQSEILAAQRARPSGGVVRHVCAAPHLEMVDASHMRGVTYFQIYRGSGDGQSVLPMTEPEVLGQFEDEFVLTPQGWRIRSRRARGVFRKVALESAR